MEDEQINHSGDIGGNSGTEISEASINSQQIISGIETIPPNASINNEEVSRSPLDRDEDMNTDREQYRDNDSRLNAMKHNLITMNRGNGFNSNKNSDLDRQISILKNCECIKESEVRDLCNMARDILLEESNIQNI